MHVVVCGGRDYDNKQFVFDMLDALWSGFTISKLHTGDSTGADEHAAEWARNKPVPYSIWEADWIQFGKPAGPMRNEAMLAFVEKMSPRNLVVAFPGGKGTANTIRQACAKMIQVWEPAKQPELPNIL